MSADKVTLDGLRIDRSAIPKRQERPAWVLPAIGGVIVVGLVAGWWASRPAPVVVETAVAQLESTGGTASNGQGQTRTPLLNGSGYVTARREATVSSKVTGKVMEVLVEEGMKVEAGQILAKLDATNSEASMRLAEAQLDSAKKALEETKPGAFFAGQELKRFRELAASKAASQSDLNKADADLKAVEAKLVRQTADITVAQREVDQWKQQVDDTIIRAPFSGIVTSKNSQPGEMISPMSAGGFTRTGICTIVDMSSLEIEVDVSESYINRVVDGQPVEARLDAYADWAIPAKVIAIIPTADRQKATVKVRIGFEKLDPRILPEMGVKVSFHSPPEEKTDTEKGTTGGSSLVLVPRSALHKDGSTDIVWIYDNGEAESRAVAVAGSRGEQMALKSGVAHGEKVILKAPPTLKDGSKVTEKK